MSEPNGATKTVGVVIAVVSVIGALAGVMTQYVQHSDEKHKIWRENSQRELERLDKKQQEIERSLNEHEAHPEIHHAAIVRLTEKLESIKQKLDEMREEQLRRTQRVYSK